MAAQPLQGIRILDLSQLWAGPYCTRLLADLGAEVIKIEGPRNPDFTRGMPQFPGGEPGPDPWNRAGFFNDMNRDKLGLSLDLRHPAGQAVFRRLVAVSDVVVENYTPRVMATFGLEYPVLQALRPGLIMISIPGFGRSGPYRDYAALGATVEQVSGLSWVTGYPDKGPQRAGISYGDPIAALQAALAAIALLHRRAATGEGVHVDLSLCEGLTALIPEFILDAEWNGRHHGPQGNSHALMVPHGCFPCRGDDEWVTIACPDEAAWEGLCVAVNPAWQREPRFVDQRARWANREVLHRELSAWTAERTPGEVTQLLQVQGVAAAPVLRMDALLADPQLAERGLIQAIATPRAGVQRHRGRPWLCNGERGPAHRPGPTFGQHNRAVLQGLLGLSDGEIAELAAQGVISDRPL